MSRFSVLKSNKVLAPPASPIQVPSPQPPAAAITSNSPEPRRFGFRPTIQNSESRSSLQDADQGTLRRSETKESISQDMDVSRPQTPAQFEARKSSGIFKKPVPVTPSPEDSPTPGSARSFGLRKVQSNESIPNMDSPTSERRVFDKSVFGANTGMSAFSSKPRVKREDPDVMPKELEITDENSFIFKAIAKKYGLAIKEEIKLESMIQFPSLGPIPSPIIVNQASSPVNDEAAAVPVVAPKKNMWSKIAAAKVEEPKEEEKPEEPKENVIHMDLHALVNSTAINNVYRTAYDYLNDWTALGPAMKESEVVQVVEEIPEPMPEPVVPKKPKSPIKEVEQSGEPLTAKQKALNSFFKKKK